MSNIENKLGRINSLDLLRVISAGIVFLFHIYKKERISSFMSDSFFIQCNQDVFLAIS